MAMVAATVRITVEIGHLDPDKVDMPKLEIEID